MKKTASIIGLLAMFTGLVYVLDLYKLRELIMTNIAVSAIMSFIANTKDICINILTIFREYTLNFPELIIIIFILIGYWRMCKSLKQKHPRFTTFLSCNILLIITLFPLITDTTESFLLSNLKDLKAVECYAQRTCDFSNMPGTDNTLLLRYSIPLKNHSNDEVSFYMKVEVPDILTDKTTKIDVTEADKDEPLRFSLFPGETKIFRFNLQIPYTSDTSLAGRLLPNVVIYNEDNSKSFKNF